MSFLFDFICRALRSSWSRLCPPCWKFDRCLIPGGFIFVFYLNLLNLVLGYFVGVRIEVQIILTSFILIVCFNTVKGNLLSSLHSPLGITIERTPRIFPLDAFKRCPQLFLDQHIPCSRPAFSMPCQLFWRNQVCFRRLTSYFGDKHPNSSTYSASLRWYFYIPYSDDAALSDKDHKMPGWKLQRHFQLLSGT